MVITLTIKVIFVILIMSVSRAASRWHSQTEEEAMRQKKLRFEKMLELGGKNYRAENIKEVNPTYEGPVVAIELFYMTAEMVKVVRRSSSYAGAPTGSHLGWTVMRLDAEGNKYGECRKGTLGKMYIKQCPLSLLF